MLTIHHLAVSQSDRVVWLMEELGLPYGRKTKTGYSTAASVLEGLREGDEVSLLELAENGRGAA